MTHREQFSNLGLSLGQAHSSLNNAPGKLLATLDPYLHQAACTADSKQCKFLLPLTTTKLRQALLNHTLLKHPRMKVGKPILFKLVFGCIQTIFSSELLGRMPFTTL